MKRQSSFPSKTIATLFEAAMKARNDAYAPYSRFAVGASLRSTNGKVFAGCNVENASYPVGTCAEAGAIAVMVAQGHKRIAEFLVVGGSGEPVTPCGACRQRLREFADPSVLVHCASPSGELASYSVETLLPATFGPKHLGERR